jgi:hypothetical protein
MTFDEFEQRAWEEWERIPEEYRAGVDGLVIDRAALPHPSLPDVYTLGECRTESYPSQFEGPDTVRSVVVLYYGSFFRLSRLDREFDWNGELWETLTHELQHHLESLASDDALGGMDYAADENFKRGQGEPFDAFFYRHGLVEGEWRRVEDEHFLERPLGSASIDFDWDDRRYRIPAPTQVAEVTFIDVAGVEGAPGPVTIVLVRRTGGLLASLRSLLRREPPRVVEAEADAVPVDPAREG